MNFKILVNLLIFILVVFNSCSTNHNSDDAMSEDVETNYFTMGDSVFLERIESGLKNYFSKPKNNQALEVDYSQDYTYFEIESIDSMNDIYVIWSSFSMGSPCTGTQISTFNNNLKMIDCESFFTECDCPSECEGCGLKFITKHSYNAFAYTEINDEVHEYNASRSSECVDCDCIIKKDEITSEYLVNPDGQITVTNSYSTQAIVGSQYTQTIIESKSDSVNITSQIIGIASIGRSKSSSKLKLWNNVFIEDIRANGNFKKEDYALVIPINAELPILKLKIQKSDNSPDVFENIINSQYWDYDNIQDGFSMNYPFEVALLSPTINKAKLVDPKKINIFPKNVNADLVKVAVDINQDNQADLLFCEFNCVDSLPIERGLHNSCNASYVLLNGEWSTLTKKNN
ncbi:MAG: hypothetical protein P8I11_07390 [Bacteroidia bacterium]|nr:hypothetical protein [Bacteroidia bacterium]